MPRKAITITASLEEKRQLERLASGRVVSKQLAERAQIILDCLTGKENQDIATKRGICQQTVAKWRNRFSERRLDRLSDASRAREPSKYGKELRDEILKILELPPPKGYLAGMEKVWLST